MSARNGSRSQPRPIRCAIYTRKSTEEGLEQEFNTLDAQRESGEQYIASQAGEGWVCLPDRYDDGGFTGGNMERPALKRLLKDIEAGRIDCVIVNPSPPKPLIPARLESNFLSVNPSPPKPLIPARLESNFLSVDI